MSGKMGNKNPSEEQQAVSSYYDDFKVRQVATGVNLRHYLVFDKCIRAGLKKNHRVLEIGCGIGTFTRLLAGFVTKGSILAADISSESIEHAKVSLKSRKNVRFIVSDMKEFPEGNEFDFVVMVDVLEHIPFEQYDQLFGIINANTHENSILAINIPHPDSLNFMRKTHPEKLQIIDNSIEMDFLSKHIYENGLKLNGYNTYSINNFESDYVFMTFEKDNKNKDFRHVSNNNVRIKKLIFRIKYLASIVFHK